jgi:hypothetical protein
MEQGSRCSFPLELRPGIPEPSCRATRFRCAHQALNRHFKIFALILTLTALPLRAASAQPVAVTKANPMKVYMHYMPWFDAPAPGGTNWGLHWTMATRNPNIVDATGKRQIASHYYPKIGPYESSDPDVLEYHMLLMKYSGVDGILMDWYGSRGSNGDVNSLLVNSNAIVNKTDDFGIKFAVTAEDNYWSTFINGNEIPDISKAKDSFKYLKENYFSRPEYIRLGVGDDPLVTVFGPQTFTKDAGLEGSWTEILAEAGEDVNFLPLWYERDDAGGNADGEFAWVYQDGRSHLSHTTGFYTGRAPSLNVAGGAAYPGFDDYYAEGGWGNNLFEIPANDGQTLQDTLDLATQYSNRIDFLQLVTWNDFGEGTMMEPTVETGFSYLRKIQQFTGVAYDEDELQLIYRLYLARKKYAGDAPIVAMLNQVSTLLAQLEVGEATELLNSAAPAGDFDADGDVDAADYQVWRTAYGSETILHGSGADGNYDGKVNTADFTIWRNSLGTGGDGGTGSTVPEPSSLALSVLAGAALCQLRTFARIRAGNR